MSWQQSDKHQRPADRRRIPDGTYVDNVRIGPPEDPTVRIGARDTGRGIDIDPSITLNNVSLRATASGVRVGDVEDVAEEPPMVASRVNLRVPLLAVNSDGLEIK